LGVCVEVLDEKARKCNAIMDRALEISEIDCSEVAEDLLNLFGEGEIFTYSSVKGLSFGSSLKSFGKQIVVPFSGGQKFLYHTVFVLGGKVYCPLLPESVGHVMKFSEYDREFHAVNGGVELFRYKEC
jgi:hypothetical protein